jgi:hypothetical protein
MKEPLKLKLKRDELLSLQRFLAKSTKSAPSTTNSNYVGRLTQNVARDFAIKLSNKLVSNPFKKQFNVTLKENDAIATWCYLIYDYSSVQDEYSRIVLNDLLTKTDQYLQ